jgi:hypothetical protein
MESENKETECTLKQLPPRVTDKGFYLGMSWDNERVYLEPFKWECSWYWGGGYLESTQNGAWCSHSHVGELKKDGDLFDWFKKHFAILRLSEKQLWRLCDLFQQFYVLKEAADVYKSGGNYSSEGRNKKEIDLSMYKKINKQIANVIIPEIYKCLNWNSNHEDQINKMTVDLKNMRGSKK